MKKGISPLIATVLLIGFTIVLAALVMQWGSQLFRSTTESTGVASDINLKCSSGLNGLKVTAVSVVDGVTVDNTNELQVDGVIIRVTTSTETKTYTFNQPISAFGVKTYVGEDESTTPQILTIGAGNSIGVIPKIKGTDGKLYPCPGVELKATVQ